jgi:hypothetical protein
MKALRKYMTGAALCSALVLGVGSAALAGEVTGSGKGGPEGTGTTGAHTNSNSECAFSGLEDGSEGGPAGPGAPPQNWGQIPKFVRDVILTPEGLHPGQACNGNLAGRK